MSYDLERFVAAQDSVWDTVRAELRDGRKRSHWMWFVFPQEKGLGRSPTSVFYALDGVEEARAYLAHPVLGARLREATDLVLGHAGQDPRAIFGPVDAMKFHSSMSLFRDAAPDERLFQDALSAFYPGAVS